MRELLHAVPAANSQTLDSDAKVDSGKPSFVCPHCGSSMLILQAFVRGEMIRAPPPAQPR